MIPFSQWTILAACSAGLAGCGAPAAPAPGRGEAYLSPAGRLTRTVERYWDENAALDPWYNWSRDQLAAAPPDDIAPQSMADSLALERRYLWELSATMPAGLDAESRLTYEMFRRDRLSAIEGFTYPTELLPMNPYEGMPIEFALMAPAAEPLALSEPQDFRRWRTRTASFARFARQAIANMRDGMRRGYTLPRPTVEKLLPQLAALGEDGPANPFYQSMPPDSAHADAAGGPGPGALAGSGALSAARAGMNSHAEMIAVIKSEITPSYRSLHDFLTNEYLPRARASVALSSLPLGAAWYGYLVRRVTGGTLTPAELHVLGVAELERLHQRVQTLLSDSAFPGDPTGFVLHMRHDPRFSYHTPAELLAAYQEQRTEVTLAMAPSFGPLPTAGFQIRSVEAFREPAAPPLSYAPRSPNGLVPAILYVNTAQLDARPALFITSQFLREALPGRHYVQELQHERLDLPRFRRFGARPAFVEGWGLYAAALGEELGLYHDAEARFGAWLAQAACAAGLVIDTGLHAQGWTRRQALDYVLAQVPVDDEAAEQLVDRVVALPAEALACTVGFLKFQSLRSLAQQTLGSRFDLHAFNTELVSGGAMPLDLLEARVRTWLVEAAARPPESNASAGAADAPTASCVRKPPGGNPALIGFREAGHT
jgi:uncharacterized protein (DUF885 family)